MEINDLIIYGWNNLSLNSISEYEIKGLLQHDLFRLYHETIQGKLKVPISGISMILFVCDGVLEIAYNGIVYTIKSNQFIQIPKGQHIFKCSENSVFYKAILTRDIPFQIIKQEREKFAEVRCKTLITHSMNWWRK